MRSEIENLTRAAARPLSHVEQDAEADLVPNDWLTWSKSTGTLAEHLAGTAPWSKHERREIPMAPVSARVLRGPQDHKTLHLGRGTVWHRPKR